MLTPNKNQTYGSGKQSQVPEDDEVYETQTRTQDKSGNIQHIGQYQNIQHHHYYGKNGLEEDTDYDENEDEQEQPERPKILGPGCSPIALIKAFFTIILFPFKVWGFVRSIIWLIIFSFLAVILIIILKPPGLWNPLKNLINGDLQLPVISEVNLTDTYTKINDIAKDRRSISLNESEFTTLVKDKIQPKGELKVGLEENLFRFYINIDNADAPLWLLVDFKLNSGSEKIEISNIAIGSVNVPDFLVSFVSNQLGGLQGVINNTIGGNSSLELMSQLLDEQKLDKRLALKSIQAEKQKITLNYSFDEEFNF